MVTDEPLSGLDLPIQVELIRLLKKIHERRNLTMLFISHDLRHVRALATRVLVLYRGTLVEDAPADQFFSETGRRHPYSKELLLARSGKPIDIPTELVVGEEGRGCPYMHDCKALMEPSESCATISPKLIEISPGHRVACHKYQD